MGGTDLPLTVYPFILRGVPPWSASTRPNVRWRTRAHIWGQLAGAWKPKHLEQIATVEVNLRGLDEQIQLILAGKTTGRVIVRPTIDDGDDPD